MFRQPPILNGGETIYSGQMNALAVSWNDRLMKLGDPAWHVAFLADSFTGMIRNPNQSANLFPPRHEWLKLYAQTRQPWTVAGPGEPEGLNVNSPLAGFYAGQEANNLLGEATRLSGENILDFTGAGQLRVPVTAEDAQLTQVELWSLSSGEPTTDREFWVQGRKQRGLTDGQTERSPFAMAAASHLPLVPNHRAKLGLTFGGYQPAPKVVGSCQLEASGVAEPDYQFTFRPLQDGLATLTYRGFCPSANPSAALANLIETPTGYVLWFQDGNVQVLSFDDYLLVNDGTAYLTHQPGPWFGQGRQYLWDLIFTKFVSEFKGDNDIRVSETWRIRETSVEWEKMGNRQSLLAPARATRVGDYLEEVRTRFENGAGGFTTGGNASYAVADGFTCVGVFVEGVVSKPVTLKVMAGGLVAALVECTPADGGVIEALQIFREDQQGEITVEAVGDVDGETIAVELIELVQRQMTIQEFYVFARLAMAQAGDRDVLGNDWVDPIVRSDGYFRYGAIVNSAVPGLTHRENIVGNGIYESARQMIDGYVKLATRDQYDGYGVEVVDNVPKSYFIMRRRVMNPNDRTTDLFEGLGPRETPLHPEGTIERGQTYVVDSPEGGTITYNGVAYKDMEVFEGVLGQKDFTPAGNAVVREWEGIRAEALDRGFSNEWVTFLSFCPFSESGLFRPETFSDIMGNLSNPTHLFSEELRRGGRFFNPRLSDLARIVSIGQADVDGDVSTRDAVSKILVSKSPSRLKFAKGSHGPTHFLHEKDERIAFYKSNQLYRDPYYIESVTPIRENGKWDKVKIRLNRRLDHHSHVSGRIFSQSLEHWKIDDSYQWLHEEPYATDESRVMKYLLWRDRGEGFQPVIGDVAASAWADRSFEVNRGNFLPFFHYVKLIEKVRTDDNLREDAHDTDTWMHPFLHMAFCAPICEVFIDRAATEGQVCERVDDLDLNPPTLFEYSIPECCRQAFGGRHFEFLPEDVRPRGRAFGAPALPNTEMWKHSYNQFAQFIRLLQRVRLDLPLRLEEQTTTTNGLTVITSPDQASDLGETSLGEGERVPLHGAGNWVIWQGNAAYTGEGEPVVQPWFDFDASSETDFIASRGTSIAPFLISSGGVLRYVAQGSEVRTVWRIAADQEAIHAIPPELRPAALLTPGLLLRRYDTIRVASYVLSQGAAQAKEDHRDEDGSLSPGVFTPIVSDGVAWGSQSFTTEQRAAGWDGIQVTVNQTRTVDCLFLSGSTVVAPDPGIGAIVFQSPENHVQTSVETVMRPVGDQIGNGNLFITIPVEPADISG